jgi:tetratricopeptide (TPR) repeat protein
LLKVPQVDQAIMMARQAVAVAETKMARFDSQVRQANQTLVANASLAASPVPMRISVVATRMGNLFLQEGEPEAAAEFFLKAIQSAKGGANRARQGMAMIAMARGEYAEAAETTAEAIRIGHYRVKTLPAWSIHISARRKQGCWRVNDRLIKGLEKAPASLRARATLAIVTELR